MAKENTTVETVLFKSKILKNGENPIMMRITKNRKAKYISLGISCNPKYWNSNKHEPRKSHPNKDVLDVILSREKEKYLNQILEYLKDGKDYTPDSLIQDVEKRIKKITVLDYFDVVVKDFEGSKRVAYAKVFREAKTTVRGFTKGRDLTFDQIDYGWLCKLEKSLRLKDHSDNAISIRMRTIRTLYNNAIREGYAKAGSYPFKEYKISKRFDTSTRKRAIRKSEVKAIEALELKPYSMTFEAQQYFLFSYYGQGINFIDIAYLKWENMEAGRITYRRSKTKELITFKVTPPIERIIAYFEPFTNGSKNSYIFPILKQGVHVTAQQQYDRTRKVLKRVNKDLKAIGEMTGLDTPLTFYVARHSFATVLKSSGVSIAIISETMGHASEAITHTYLKSFEDNVIDEALRNL